MVTGMIGKVSDAMVRHRHVVLMLGLRVAGVNVAAVGFVPTLGQRLFFPLLLLRLAVLVLALIAMGIRPVYLVVQPQVPAFATPAPAWKVLIALGFLAPASAQHRRSGAFDQGRHCVDVRRGRQYSLVFAGFPVAG